LILRRTKIVATLGPATERPHELDRLVRAGLDVARVNFSHGEREKHIATVNELRAAAAAHGRQVGILVDLRGPKIRIEAFRDGRVRLEDGQSFVIDPDLPSTEGDESRVGISYKGLSQDVNKDDVLLLDDGNIVMKVDQIQDGRIHCRVVNGGFLSNNKGLNRLGGGLSTGALTEKDEADIELAAEMQADYLAVSFVREASDILRARELLRRAGGDGRIVAKIERADVIDKIDEIVEAADAIMIARGDLGVEIGDAELPAIQKKLIRQARESNRVVITATQMMQSMVESPLPTRAEVMDVANAVIDGTDAVMLSAETAVGAHPTRVVLAMDRICRGAERQRVTMVSSHRVDTQFETAEEAIAMAAMYTANHLKVAAIVALTESGDTAKWMSRISSGIPIFAMSPHIGTVRRVSLYRGVYPILFEDPTMTTKAAEQFAIEKLKQAEVVQSGDAVIMTKGARTGIVGGTNSMKVLKV